MKHETPLRVLHLLQGLEIGGLEHMVASLVKGLDRNRFHPSVCCFDTLGGLADSLEGIDMHLLRRMQGIDYAYPFKLASLLKRERIDILHLHNSTAFFYGVIAGRIARVPAIVYTEHARDIFPNIKVRIADKILSHFVDQIVVVADFLKENLIRHEWFNPSKIVTIYNGIDGERFNQCSREEEIRKDLAIADSCRIIGIVARLDPIKNHRCLLSAMQRVANEIPESILLIIGAGPMRGELEDIAKSHGLGKEVRFLGVRDDIPELLSIMDLFVLCSISEGLPMTVLEAMAAGRPVVATSVGGIPEVIEDGVDGMLVPSDDPAALAEAMISLLRDNEKALRLGLAAKRKFDREFTLGAMIKKYEGVYDSLSHLIRPSNKP